MRPKNAAENKAAESQRHTPLPPEIPPSPQHKRQRRECRPDQTPAWKIWLEFAAICVGLWVAIIYSRQLGEMIESNKINRASLVAVQRAFIHFKEFRSGGVAIIGPNGRPSGRRWRFSALFENSGNTPGIEVINTFTITDHLPSAQEFIQNVKRSEFRKTDVGPKAPLDLGPQYRTEDDLFGPGIMKVGKIESKKIDKQIVFFGWIAYRDVFPQTNLHITEFCHQLTSATLAFGENPPKVMPTYPPFNFGFQACTEHNCTDDYCSDYKELEAFVLGK